MVFKADDMLRSCTFVDLVKCRGLVAAVVGCVETYRAEAETHCAEACCAEAFSGWQCEVWAAIADS